MRTLWSQMKPEMPPSRSQRARSTPIVCHRSRGGGGGAITRGAGTTTGGNGGASRPKPSASGPVLSIALVAFGAVGGAERAVAARDSVLRTLAAAPAGRATWGATARSVLTIVPTEVADDAGVAGVVSMAALTVADAGVGAVSSGGIAGRGTIAGAFAVDAAGCLTCPNHAIVPSATMAPPPSSSERTHACRTGDGDGAGRPDRSLSAFAALARVDAPRRARAPCACMTDDGGTSTTLT